MDPGSRRLGYLAMALAFVAGLALAGLLGQLLHWRGVRRMRRAEQIVALLAQLACGAGLLCFLYALLIEADWLQVSFTQVRSAKLAAGARLRIVHLTDLHVGAATRALAELPGRVAELKPDVVVFTGDSLNQAEALPRFRELFAALPAPAGRYAVRGNHDTWYWSQLELFGGGVAAELLGAAPRERPEHNLALCGAPYGVTGQLSECLRRARGRFRVVAYHTPDLVEEMQASEDPPDLYLAGHTHGGQVRAPFYGALITLSVFDKKYEMGRYDVGGTALYVSRGVGFEPGAPRVRFLCRPEIAVIDVLGTGP